MGVYILKIKFNQVTKIASLPPISNFTFNTLYVHNPIHYKRAHNAHTLLYNSSPATSKCYAQKFYKIRCTFTHVKNLENHLHSVYC